MSIDLLSVRRCHRPEVSKLFSIHGNRENIEDFVGHMVSVAPAQRCCLGWLCPRKTLFTEMGQAGVCPPLLWAPGHKEGDVGSCLVEVRVWTRRQTGMAHCGKR